MRPMLKDALRPSLLAFALAACGASPPPMPPSPAPAAAPAPPAARRHVTPRGLDETDRVFLQTLAETRTFSFGRPTSARPLPHHATVLFLRGEARSSKMALFSFDATTGETTEVITAEALQSGGDEKLSPEERARRERLRITATGLTAYEPSPDGSKVLVPYGPSLHLVTLADRSHRVLVGPDAQGRAPFDARFSPDGRRLAFVRGGALWVMNTGGGPPRRLSPEARGTVTYALAEFVAQEEMDRQAGYFWSGDGEALIYQTTDTAKVEALSMVDPAELSGTEPLPYPRPGHENAAVDLSLVSVKGGRPTRIVWDAPAFPYVARVKWPKGGPPTVLVEARDQRSFVLLEVNVRTGATSELLRETDTVFLNLPAEHDHRVLESGEGFLWPTERGGAWQLELRSRDGSLRRKLTPTTFRFGGVRALDEAARTIVVAGFETLDPTRQGLFRFSLDLDETQRPVRLSPESLWIDAVYTSKSKVSLQVQDGLDITSKLVVLDASGAPKGTLPSVAESLPAPPNVEHRTLGESPALHAAIIRPRDFDKNASYPVWVNVYGGPHGLTVAAGASAYVRDQWIADHGYLVLRVDGRGTPGRGRDFERAIFGQLAEVPMSDQVKGLEALLAAEPAADGERVGMTGHSYGGYISALAALTRPQSYRATVASAPVTDWLDYDTHYTERYLGVPDLQREGGDAVYVENSLLRHAGSLSVPLLLIHGTADDNVHFKHSLKLADALFRAGRDFRLVPIAGMTHLPRGAELLARYYALLFDFFGEHLR